MEKNEISKIETNLDKQASQLEVSIFNLSQANQSYLPAHIKNDLDNEIKRLRDIQDEIRNSMVKLDEVNKTLTSDNKTKNSLHDEISALDVTIMRLQNAITPRMTTNDKNRLTVITNYLIDTRNRIATHIAQFGHDNISYIQKMLTGAKALCEEHEDIVKGIIDTPKSSDEQIAEDFVENVWNKQ